VAGGLLMRTRSAEAVKPVGVRFLASIVALLCWVVVGVSTGIPTVAHAQTTSIKGWCTAKPSWLGGGEACYREPGSACASQYAMFKGPGAVWDGMRDSAFWYSKTCNWHYIPPNSGILGSSITFKCNWPYVETAPGTCPDPNEKFQETNCNNRGGTVPTQTPYPIRIMTGAKRFTATDFMSADGGLRLTRHYGSWGGALWANIMRGPTGLANWAFDFQFEMQLDRNWQYGSMNAAVSVPCAGYYTFERQSSGAMNPFFGGLAGPQTDYRLSFVGTWPGSPNTVVNASSNWILRGPNDEVIEITTYLDTATGKYLIGRPTTITDRNGHQLTLAYNSSGQLQSITDNFGKQITFSWTGSSPEAVSQAVLPGGYKVNYTYDVASGDQPAFLKKVEYLDPSGTVLDSTTYENADTNYVNAITGIFDKNGVRRWTVTYDGLGRATSSTGPSGYESYSVSYSAVGNPFTRTVTNPYGRTTTYTFSKSSAPSARVTGMAGSATTNVPSSSNSESYGTDNFVSQITDELGRLTTYTHDSRGMPSQVVEASGTGSARTTSITWHSSLGVPTHVVGPKATMDYSYDTQGRLTSLTVTDTTSYTTPYATNGRTRTWGFTWNSAGELLTVDGPLSGTGDTTTYAYDSNGYLSSVTDAVGHVTQVTSVDWRGAPLTVVDANSVSTTYTYDIHGRVLTMTRNPGSSQSQYQFSYDAVGNVSQVTLPGGGYLQYTYDNASRPTLVTNDRGQTITVGTDAGGNVTSLVTKTSGSSITQQASYAYDEIGRMLQEVGAGSQTWSMAYDKLNNLTGVTDARGKLFQASFDALNRVTTETDPETHTVQYAYDGEDQLTGLTDGRSHATTRTVDGFGQVIREVSPERGTIDYWYDAAGRLTKVVDGDGVEADHMYDNADRRLTTTFPSASAETITYSYDSTTGGNPGVGRLTSVSDETGSSSFTYDAQGRVTQDAKVIQSRSYAVQYAYDVNGKITQLVLPSGRIVDIARASDGLVTGVTTKASSGASAVTIASSVTYAPFGPLTGLSYGNGLSLARSYDQNYWLTDIQVTGASTATLDLSFGRNANGELTGVTDNAATGRGATFGYTDTGRLNAATGPWGTDSYTYDAAGNRTQKARTVGSTTTTENLILASTSNRATQVQDGSSTTLRSFTLRTGGALSSDAYAGSDTFGYSYNARGRIAVVQKNSADAGWYGYDAFGRRVWRTVIGTSNVTTHYIFDESGRLLAEHDGSTGNVVKEYVWIDDMPIAVIDSSSGTATTYFIHTGQIDEPLVMTDGSKAKVWDAYVEPFGKAQVFGTASADIDMRLPGQFLQQEMEGLHQNWNREYDPSLGRYVEADPLGVDAGQNVYAYVDGSPLNFSDLLGLYHSAQGANISFTPAMQSALGCFDMCTRLDSAVTSGRRDQPNTGHGRGEACDLGRGANPLLTRSEAIRCFHQCFPRGYGQEEGNQGSGSHFHLQLYSNPGVNPNTFSPIVRPYNPHPRQTPARH
jgi:RHS repeat-associated protein